MPTDAEPEHDFEELVDETTNSGKMLFRCKRCGRTTPAPTRGRCGKCPKCGHYFTSVGHVLNCDNLNADEQAALAEFRRVLHAPPRTVDRK